MGGLNGVNRKQPRIPLQPNFIVNHSDVSISHVTTSWMIEHLGTGLSYFSSSRRTRHVLGKSQRTDHVFRANPAVAEDFEIQREIVPRLFLRFVNIRLAESGNVGLTYTFMQSC